jgi:cation diffusion facilitator family transporter
MDALGPGGREHDHAFGQDIKRIGEQRTFFVIGLTASMMIVEIIAGILFGSMALLADGLHMASHAAALSVTAVAYVYARRHARDSRFSFGTGKVNALGGFTSAVLLALFAILMVVESAERFLHPVEILFDQAIFVAVLGLLVNGASALILSGRHDHGGGAGSAHDHSDHNLRAAYFHVLADALTSLLAIFALFAGKLLGLTWMDPTMGVVGAFLVGRWSWGLLRQSGWVLLDQQAPSHVLEPVRKAIEDGRTDQVSDLHVWSIGPSIFAASLSIVTDDPQSPEHYRSLIPDDIGLVHTVIEVRRPPR